MRVVYTGSDKRFSLGEIYTGVEGTHEGDNAGLGKIWLKDEYGYKDVVSVFDVVFISPFSLMMAEQSPNGKIRLNAFSIVDNKYIDSVEVEVVHKAFHNFTKAYKELYDIALKEYSKGMLYKDSALKEWISDMYEGGPWSTEEDAVENLLKALIMSGINRTVYTNTDHVVKYTVDESGLNMFISHEDLKFLVDSHPSNFNENMEKYMGIRKGMEVEVAKHFVDRFNEEESPESNVTLLGSVFDVVIDEALEGCDTHLFDYFVNIDGVETPELYEFNEDDRPIVKRVITRSDIDKYLKEN